MKPRSSFPRPLCLAAALTLALLSPVRAANGQNPTSPGGDRRLEPVYRSNRVWNGVTFSADGRVFVCYPGADGQPLVKQESKGDGSSTLRVPGVVGPGMQVEEILKDGSRRAYPDEAWNSYRQGKDIAGAFVCVNALRVGPDGKLYIIDAGAPGPGKEAIPGAGRVIVVDLATDKVSRVYDLAKAARPRSYIDDIRFNGGRAYITDVGEPGLVVLDLASGDARRLLHAHPTATANRPMYADGRVMYESGGKERRSHTDQLEVSPDGKYLYYLPCPGPTARIETRWLDDPALSPEEVARHAETWLDTPTCGGTAIDADGNLYYSDTDAQRILKITPDKQVSTVVADPRLQWSDAMWIDKDGFLWLPVSKQEFTAGFNAGKNEVEYPVWIYKLQIGAWPAPNDHP